MLKNINKALLTNHFINISLLLIVFAITHINLYSQTPEQITFYSDRIEFGTDNVKRNALFDLRNFQTEVASRIAIPALRDNSEIIRATATHSVIFLPIEESSQVLIPLLNDKSEFVRRETAYALGKTQNPEVYTNLINLIKKEKKQSVKDAATVALGLIGHIRAIPTLEQILLSKPKKKHTFFRRAAARSIGQIAEKAKNQKITKITPENFLPLNYKTFENATNSKELNNSNGFANTVTILINTARNRKESQDTRREATFALGAIGNSKAIELLLISQKSEDLYLAEISTEALEKLKQN